MSNISFGSPPSEMRTRFASFAERMFAGLIGAVSLLIPAATPAAVMTDEAVVPILECVEHDVPSPGLYTAHWGYDNKNSSIVNIPVNLPAPHNEFTPFPIDRGQPVFFSPGRHYFVFTTVDDGNAHVWTLTGPDGHTRTVAATRNPLQQCRACGDGVVTRSRCHGKNHGPFPPHQPEECDDGNTLPGDGCSATCTIEPGWTCSGEPSSCGASCGDGLVTGSETCDDGGAVSGDGCNATCQVEAGWVCSGAPSVCAPSCGNGAIDGSETCDDGNTSAGDGCDDVCQVEAGWSCSGAPSACSATCGDALVTGGEQCDDGNGLAGDGCSPACVVEPGWTCAGTPSACTPTCGDGVVGGSEVCDDGNGAAGDGCDGTCQVEVGWICAGSPSVCATACGDGVLAGNELCDDANATNGDGCDAWCQTEPGWACSGAPSACTPTCGDGLVAGGEQCDDGGTASGDGCSGSCQVEPGWGCLGAPSVCLTSCGDGIPAGAETCDDGNATAGDGCDGACQTEIGWACSGVPSTCATPCGDGIRAGAEQCDDGNLVAGDCCSATCTLDAPGDPCGGDGNGCTDDVCNGAGVCTHPNNTASCDDGDACTLSDVCSAGVCTAGAPKDCTDGNPCTEDVCTAGTCSNPPLVIAPQADFIFVVDASKSMSKPWRSWLASHLGNMPDRLDAAGIDWRISIVRFSTFGNPKRGTLYPDVFLDWTSDAQTWRNALPQLGTNPRIPLEAGTEAMHWGLDRLTFRPNAFANIVLYTNEDDDAPASEPGLAYKKEPPSGGPKCIGNRCEASWLAAQSRVDSVASRMIAQRIQVNLIIRTLDKPTQYQYGDHTCTVLLPDQNLDLAATLACLVSKGEQQSLQGQLLSAGVCTAGTCSAGLVGGTCATDTDCSILARAYKIPRSQRQADAFFPDFLADKVREQSCTP